MKIFLSLKLKKVKVIDEVLKQDFINWSIALNKDFIFITKFVQDQPWATLFFLLITWFLGGRTHNRRITYRHINNLNLTSM